MGLELERRGFDLETISKYALRVADVFYDIRRLREEYLGEKPVELKGVDRYSIKRRMGMIQQSLELLELSFGNQIPASQEFSRLYKGLEGSLFLVYGTIE